MEGAESMIERVARAISDAELCPSHSCSGCFVARANVLGCQGREVARVAIEAMREPTEHMLVVGEAQDCFNIYGWARRAEPPPTQTELDEIKAIFTAMIDAALSPKSLTP